MQHRWMWRFVESRAPQLRGSRCLDWDGWYGGSVFSSICAEVDVLVYATPFGQVDNRPLYWAANKGRLSARRYQADAHSMARYLPNGVYGLVIANSVFEHLANPWLAMRNVAALLRPGGLLFWHTPSVYEMHGVPRDYVRAMAFESETIP